MWGLSIRLACQVHDHEYEIGKTIEDKIIADEHLKCNGYILVDIGTSKWNPVLNRLRKNRVDCYFEMVKLGGSKAFWAKKLEQRRDKV